ncbi:glycosyltransferase family 1 protein [Clostridium butyricum]|uniref:glycosyltransferase family 1 protein n=1 Tax=Clostridium butyricum TaxID=1492 RepID=UPI0009033434|nr:glycosyltransferase family 1 protein [Clostridium butyricum]APF22863.1 glycosyl transferases group 1 family protein [Clostridium butyricum]
MKENIIRVLQVCALNAGGIESFLMNVYRKLDKKKIVFDFINYFDENKEQFHENEAKSYGSKIYKTGSMNYKNVLIRHYKKVKLLYEFLRKNKYSIIHIHASDVTSIEDAIVAKMVGIPKIIVHAHNTSISRDNNFFYIKIIVHKIVKNLWGYVATDYFACSKEAAKWMFSKKLCSNNSVQIINNAVDFKKYIFNNDMRIQIRKELKVENKFVIGHIGRMSYQKNHEYLIEIFNEVKKQYENSVLLLIGDGELKEKIREKVISMNLKDSVIFYGLTNEVENLMQAMDIFILPSHYEGLPLVGIESQAAGLQVIASDAISREMSITRNVTYLPLSCGSENWAREIIKYAYGYQRKEEYKEFENSNYNINYISNKIENFYKGEIYNV